MGWNPDEKQFPMKKPRQLEKLEQMDRVFLDSLPGVEVQDMVDNIAEAIAGAYKKEHPKGNKARCLEIVSSALTVTGSAIGGRVGTSMVAQSDKAAKRATEIYFPTP